MVVRCINIDSRSFIIFFQSIGGLIASLVERKEEEEEEEDPR